MQKFTTYKKLSSKGYEISEVIQNLWSGYGQIVRLKNNEGHSVIAKHICPPSQNNHPRGWNTNVSHQRKLKSYQVELEWYESFAELCSQDCKVPDLIGSETTGNQHLIILEDLNAAGYPVIRTSINLNEIRVVLKWLAYFHATFFKNNGNQLWDIGTYWQLSTRQDEFEAMKEGELKDNATVIHESLNKCAFQTLVHGDAKLANFCFSKNGDKVAAVDFQYVGKGCGMKDVIYFLGSCLSDYECEKYEVELLNYYFRELETALSKTEFAGEFSAIEKEWRSMYALAWADFHRFLLGWMPGHQKLTSYSRKQVSIALAAI